MDIKKILYIPLTFPWSDVFADVPWHTKQHTILVCTPCVDLHETSKNNTPHIITHTNFMHAIEPSCATAEKKQCLWIYVDSLHAESKHAHTTNVTIPIIIISFEYLLFSFFFFFEREKNHLHCNVYIQLHTIIHTHKHFLGNAIRPTCNLTCVLCVCIGTVVYALHEVRKKRIKYNKNKMHETKRKYT